MSTQAVSNTSILQELQGFIQDRRTDQQPNGSALKADAVDRSSLVQNPAFVVTITGFQGTPSPLPAQRQDFYQQRKADLQQLGEALRSGNADAAQHAYDALVALGQNGPLRNGQTFHRADRAQDFAAIGQALASGDLAGARSSFFALASTLGRHGHSVGGSLPPGLLGPPTPIPPQGTLPPGPPTLIPPSTVPPKPPAIPPQATLPPGPPTLVPPPSTSGVGGPSGPSEIIINVGGSPATSGGAGDIVVNLPQPSSTPEEVQINFGDKHGSGGQLTIDVQQQSNGAEAVSINIKGGASNYQLVLNLFEPAANSASHSGSLSLQA